MIKKEFQLKTSNYLSNIAEKTFGKRNYICTQKADESALGMLYPIFDQDG